jgi:hypothetical protein
LPAIHFHPKIISIPEKKKNPRRPDRFAESFLPSLLPITSEFARPTFFRHGQAVREIHALTREIHAILSCRGKSFCTFAGIFKEVAVGIGSAKEIPKSD